MSHKTQGRIVKTTLKYNVTNDLNNYPTIEHKAGDKVYIIENKEGMFNPLINQKIEIYYKINDNSIILLNTFYSKYGMILLLVIACILSLLLGISALI